MTVTNGLQTYALVYLSTIDKNLSIDQGREVISRRREVNRAVGASGLLIYSGGNILRVLEGNKDIVQKLYEHARLEPQHDVTKIYFGPIPHRYFSDYPLALRIIGGSLKPLDDFQSEEMKEYWDMLLELNEPVINLIKDFIRNNS
ncbi:MAG: hypothetical protein JWN56_2555 [Sphingobacteriales bacterium]|nr:hypothetical protein [Sphingobacteriales bacterium]